MRPSIARRLPPPPDSPPHDPHPDPADAPGWAAASPHRRPSRATVERILARASVLAAEDRELLRLAFDVGLAVSRIAALMGSGDASAIRRRIRRVARRVMSDQFVFVLAQRDRWPLSRRRIATETVVHGRSLRATALALGTTLYQVRRHRATVLAMFEAAKERA